MTTVGSPADRLSRGWWGVLVVVLASSLTADLVLDLLEPSPPGAATRVIRFFSYFTIESNLLVIAGALPLTRDAGHDGRGWRVVRLASLLGITITGIVYVVVLAPTDHPQGLRVLTNAGQHYVSPVMTLLGWGVLGPRPRVTLRVVGLALGWPFAWVAWTLGHGAVAHWYPYDFLDVSALGYPVALRNIGFVVGLAAALLLLLGGLDRRLPATSSRVPLADVGGPS